MKSSSTLNAAASARGPSSTLAVLLILVTLLGWSPAALGVTAYFIGTNGNFTFSNAWYGTTVAPTNSGDTAMFTNNTPYAKHITSIASSSPRCGLLDVSGSADVGFAGGTGTLNLYGVSVGGTNVGIWMESTAGSLTFSNTFSVQLNAALSIRNDSANEMRFLNTGTVGALSATATGSTLTFDGTGTGGITVSNAPTISGIKGAGVVVVSRPNGAVTLTSSNSYTGKTWVSNGTLRLASGGSLFGNGLVSVVSGAAFQVTNGTSTIGGVVTNAGTLSVVDAVATFNQRVVVASGGSYSFRGATNVFATGLVVAANGFLGGSGRINSSVTVTNDGTLSPGNSPGTMTFSSNLTLLNNSLLVLEIGGTNFSSYDHLIVEGTLTRAGSVLVTNLGPDFVGGESFDFIDATNWAGSFSFLTLPALSVGMTWNTNSWADGILSVSAIPEPSTLGAAAAGLALLLFLRRGRRVQR